MQFGLSPNDLSHAGRVTGIDPRVDPQTRLVSMQALLDDNRNELIVPGQFLHVRINLPVEENVATVPQTAVISSLYGDYVYVVETENKENSPHGREAGLRQGRTARGRRVGSRSRALRRDRRS